MEPHGDGFRTVFTVKSRYYVNSRPSSSRVRSIEQITAVILLSPHDRRRYRRLRADAIVKPVRPVDTFDSFGVSRSGPGANKNLRPGGTRCPHDHTTIRRRTTWYGSAPVGLYSPPLAHVVWLLVLTVSRVRDTYLVVFLFFFSFTTVLVGKSSSSSRFSEPPHRTLLTVFRVFRPFPSDSATMQVEDSPMFEGVNLKLAMDIKIKRTDGEWEPFQSQWHCCCQCLYPSALDGSISEILGGYLSSLR